MFLSMTAFSSGVSHQHWGSDYDMSSEEPQGAPEMLWQHPRTCEGQCLPSPNLGFNQGSWLWSAFHTGLAYMPLSEETMGSTAGNYPQEWRKEPRTLVFCQDDPLPSSLCPRPPSLVTMSYSEGLFWQESWVRTASQHPPPAQQSPSRCAPRHPPSKTLVILPQGLGLQQWYPLKPAPLFRFFFPLFFKS